MNLCNSFAYLQVCSDSFVQVFRVTIFLRVYGGDFPSKTVTKLFPFQNVPKNLDPSYGSRYMELFWKRNQIF